MCNLSKGVRAKGIANRLEKGRAEGIAESTLASIRNLMETLGLSLDAAMAVLKDSEVGHPRYADERRRRVVKKARPPYILIDGEYDVIMRL